MRKKVILHSLILYVLCLPGWSQTDSQTPNDKKYFAGSTLFMLGNFAAENKPDFIQINLGYRLTHKDVISIELKTWKYAWPLGIPYGKSFEAPEEKYPGYVREFGMAWVYQRFFWKGMYAAVHAMHTHQTYRDDNHQKIQNGYQLFMTYRSGYHISFCKNQFFIEPSLAATHWPVNTRVPEAFLHLENKWPNYFLFEPGLHFGYKF